LPFNKVLSSEILKTSSRFFFESKDLSLDMYGLTM